MDLIARRALLRSIIEAWGRGPTLIPNDPIHMYTACDDVTGNYVLLMVGWERARRTHVAALHLRLEPNGIISVEANTTDENVVNQLIAAGVPADEIVRGTRVPDDQIVPRRVAA